MFKKLVLLLLLIICLPIVNAESKFIDSETKNNFSVDWYLIRDGISKVRYNIFIENLENNKRDINLSSIFQPYNYPPGAIKNIKFSEYEEKTDTNSGELYYILNESKPIFSTSGQAQKKIDYNHINIGKLETKVFELEFEVPINNNGNIYGSSTKFFLGINEELYHPWLNISFFSRMYVYNIEPTNSVIVKRLTIDTRSLSLQDIIKEDCTDIRVTNSTNSELEFNLVSGCLTQNTTIDIEMSANLTDLYIYYNNPLAENVSNSSVAISIGTPSIIIDESSKGNNGIANGSIYSIGYDNGTALKLDGIGGYIKTVTPSFSNATTGSISFWFKLNDLTTFQRPFSFSTDGATDDEFVIMFNNYATGDISIALVQNGGNVWGANWDKGNHDTNWHYLNITSNGSTVGLFFDGTERTLTDQAGTNTGQWLGNATDGDVILFGALKRASITNFLNATIDEIRIHTTELVLYYSFNITDLTPSSNFTLQQYSPFFASKKLYEGVFTLDFPAPIGSSIYNIDIDLEDCGTNQFVINTNTFFFYGNVTRVTTPSIFGYEISTPAVKWEACLLDKINSSAVTDCRDYLNLLDFGSSKFLYGAGLDLDFAENLFTSVSAGANAYIKEPDPFQFRECCIPTTENTFFLSYPQELNFSSGCTDNNILIRYQRDVSLADTIEGTQGLTGGQKASNKGFFGFLVSLKEGTTGFLGTSWSIITFGFGLLIFFLSHIWLVFILFEMFAMIYSLKSTSTISEYMGTYVKVHKDGIELLIDILRLLFNFILSIINAIANLIPF